MSSAPAHLPTRLRCEVAIPAGVRQGRLPVQLRQTEPEVLELLPATGPGTATHQLINVWGKPLLTYVSETDTEMSGDMSRQGFWEFAESIELLALARPGMTVVDAGAHIGYYGALLAHTLGPTGKIYAFEPEPRNLQLLTANALLWQQLFPLAAPIVVFPCGLSDQVGQVRLNLFDEHSGRHSLVQGARKAVEMVSVTTLDTLCGPGGELAGQHLDLVKADVCGSELALVQGAQQFLRQQQPLLCLHLDPVLYGGAMYVTLLEQLSALGYTTFRVFQAIATEPYRVLTEAVPLWTAEEMLDQLRRRLIGAQGALLAFPGSAASPVDSPAAFP